MENTLFFELETPLRICFDRKIEGLIETPEEWIKLVQNY